MEAVPQVIQQLGAAGVRTLRPFGVSGVDPVDRWLLELRHLRAVLGEDWAELDLDALLEREQRRFWSGDALLFGAKVDEFVRASNHRRIGSAARRIIEVHDYQDAVARVAAFEQGVGIMIGGADKLAHAATADLAGLLRDLPEIGKEMGVTEAKPMVTDLVRELHRIAPPSISEQLLLTVDMPERFEVVGPASELGRRRARLEGVVQEMTLLAAEPATPVSGGTYVNVGIATGDNPTARPVAERLLPDTLHWLWVEVGPRQRDAVRGDSEVLDHDAITPGQEIEVVLFADDDLEVSPRNARGRLLMEAADRFRVVSPAVELATHFVGTLGERRLFFGLRTPAASGLWRIRCGLFVRGVLIHVEQLTIAVGDVDAVTSVRTTYRLVQDLSSNQGFDALVAPSLTVYANNGDETHDFSFYVGGGDEEPEAKQAHIEANKIEALISQARSTLGRVSYGRDEYEEGALSLHRFRDGWFASPTPVAEQLVDLARVGQELWLEFTTALERNPDFIEHLRDRMRTPGSVQLALKKDPTQVVPLQLLYDPPLATTLETGLTVCDATAAWLENPTGDLPCLNTPCPNEGDERRVCAAGFWGYRHAVSTSISNANPCGPGLDPAIPAKAPKPRAVAAVTTDEDVFKLWTDHGNRLRSWISLEPDPATTAATALQAMQDQRPTIAYFLAHVAYVRDKPQIVFQFDPNQPAIDAIAIQNSKLRLCASRSVVFLNACESAGLSPDRTLGLIDRFFMHGAGGAIGTEITVFADFATRFAESFVERFSTGDELAVAMRDARRAMLALHNPLGLAYTSYGLHDLHLVLTA